MAQDYNIVMKRFNGVDYDTLLPEGVASSNMEVRTVTMRYPYEQYPDYSGTFIQMAHNTDYFVCLFQKNNNYYVARSVDCAEWDTPVMLENSSGSNYTQIFTALNYFICIGSNDKYAYSSDGVIWNTNNMPTTGKTWVGNGTLRQYMQNSELVTRGSFIVVNDTNPTVIYSTTSVENPTWTQYSIPSTVAGAVSQISMLDYENTLFYDIGIIRVGNVIVWKKTGSSVSVISSPTIVGGYTFGSYKSDIYPINIDGSLWWFTVMETNLGVNLLVYTQAPGSWNVAMILPDMVGEYYITYNSGQFILIRKNAQTGFIVQGYIEPHSDGKFIGGNIYTIDEMFFAYTPQQLSTVQPYTYAFSGNDIQCTYLKANTSNFDYSSWSNTKTYIYNNTDITNQIGEALKAWVNANITELSFQFLNSFMLSSDNITKIWDYQHDNMIETGIYTGNNATSKSIDLKYKHTLYIVQSIKTTQTGSPRRETWIGIDLGVGTAFMYMAGTNDWQAELGANYNVQFTLDETSSGYTWTLQTTNTDYHFLNNNQHSYTWIAI